MLKSKAVHSQYVEKRQHKHGQAHDLTRKLGICFDNQRESDVGGAASYLDSLDEGLFIF